MDTREWFDSAHERDLGESVEVRAMAKGVRDESQCRWGWAINCSGTREHFIDDAVDELGGDMHNLREGLMFERLTVQTKFELEIRNFELRGCCENVANSSHITRVIRHTSFTFQGYPLAVQGLS